MLGGLKIKEKCYGDKYIGEVVEIKVDDVNGKHSAVFKNDVGANEVLLVN